MSGLGTRIALGTERSHFLISTTYHPILPGRNLHLSFVTEPGSLPGGPAAMGIEYVARKHGPQQGSQASPAYDDLHSAALGSRSAIWGLLLLLTYPSSVLCR